jgi:hypothetical protein
MSDPLTAETVPMDAETLEALRGSIAKWEGIVAGTDKNDGPYNCPLCLKFNSCIEGSRNYVEPPTGLVVCDGCPVQAATGKNACGGSPYEAYEEGEDEELDEEEMISLAQAELDFLKSLLPGQTP